MLTSIKRMPATITARLRRADARVLFSIANDDLAASLQSVVISTTARTVERCGEQTFKICEISQVQLRNIIFVEHYWEGSLGFFFADPDSGGAFEPASFRPTLNSRTVFPSDRTTSGRRDGAKSSIATTIMMSK